VKAPSFKKTKKEKGNINKEYMKETA